MESKRDYLLFSAEVLAQAVNDGMLSIDDYAFDVIARGLQSLGHEALANLLRKEDRAETTDTETIADRALTACCRSARTERTTETGAV